MNKTIEGISSLGPNGLTWKFIDPEHFLDFPATFSASSDFLEYMNNEYIELVNEITGVHHIGECEEWADDDIAFFKEQQEEEFFHHLISEGPGEKDEFLGEGEDEQYDENWDEDEFKH